MRKVDLDQVKHQCRIEHDDENELLESYIDAAYDYAAQFIGTSLYEFNVPDGKDGIIISASINHACLMLIGHWYANREAVTESTLVTTPLGVQCLLQPYRLMGV